MIALPQYTDDEVSSRLEFTRKMYRHIENSLTDFLDYVPFHPKHLEVFSSRLVRVILEIGPEVLSSLELAIAQLGLGLEGVFDNGSEKGIGAFWARQEELKKRRQSLTFRNYCQFLEQNIGLSKAAVRLRSFPYYMMPFEEAHPNWWNCYNALKHDKYNSLTKATLRTALNATGAFFWLVNKILVSRASESLHSELFLSISGSAGTDLKKL